MADPKHTPGPSSEAASASRQKASAESCAATMTVPWAGPHDPGVKTGIQPQTVWYMMAACSAVVVVAYLSWSAYRGSLLNPSTFWVAVGLLAGTTAGLTFVRESFLSSKGALARACFAVVGLILILETSVLLRAALR